jgi:hypothetical protein
VSNRQQRRASKSTGIDPVNVLFFSNAPWCPTGYGTQTAQVVPRMKRDGHRVAISCNYGLQGMRTVWEGIPIYPMGYDAYSNDVVGANFQDWVAQNPEGPSHIVALFDAWPLKGQWIDSMPVSIWTMIDHQPAPPKVLEVIRRSNIQPIAVSRFGQEQMARAGIDAPYIPMAIDTKNIYKPTATYNGKTGRELMGFGDDAEDFFVCSIVNANKGVPGRKAWGENLLAFSIFAAKHDDARLYIHSERHGAMGGQSLDALLAAVGLQPHQYRFVNQYANHNGIPNEAMAALYTATDLLMAATYAEGGGLTVVEAGACETPCIVNDFSAQPEMVSTDSYLTDGQPWWDAAQGAWWNIPNVRSIVAALEDAYAKGRVRSPLQREHAKQYDADHVYDAMWRPYMASIAQEHTSQTAAVDGPAPATFLRNDDAAPMLTIYVPCYKRPKDLAALMASIAGQVDERVEVIVSDDDPDGSGYAPVVTHLGDSAARVDYSRRRTNIGGDANLLRGLSVGSAPWVWVIGDDDAVLPGTVERVLSVIETDLVDRVILLSEHAPRDAAGFTGIPAELADVDPGLLVAATLVSANVVRRSALDLRLANERVDSMYANSWANTSCQMVHVLSEPGIAVGSNAVDSFVTYAAFGGTLADVHRIWADLLRGYGIAEPGGEHFAWNFVSVQNAVRAS